MLAAKIYVREYICTCVCNCTHAWFTPKRLHPRLALVQSVFKCFWACVFCMYSQRRRQQRGVRLVSQSKRDWAGAAAAAAANTRGILWCYGADERRARMYTSSACGTRTSVLSNPAECMDNKHTQSTCVATFDCVLYGTCAHCALQWWSSSLCVWSYRRRTRRGGPLRKSVCACDELFFKWTRDALKGALASSEQFTRVCVLCLCGTGRSYCCSSASLLLE